jgi:hypothetical protein
LETERSQKKQDLVIMVAFQSISFALGPNVALRVTRNEKGTLALLGTHFLWGQSSGLMQLSETKCEHQNVC